MKRIFEIKVLLLFSPLLFFIGIFYLLNISQTNKIAIIPASYDFEYIPHDWLTMPDGVRLSASYWKPKTKKINQKFPIVLEVLPYRKDDVHFNADYAIGRYFARRGIAFARVDIRGTGASEGAIPDREYSDQELNDIREVIKQLVKKSWSDGNIGMQGISWSAFNSIMTAMRSPRELKGILIAHGSDDLYANDIHNIDGALHLDIFTLQIEVDNLLPQSPHYLLDENYFKNRFESKPWIFSILQNQRDGSYWQKNRSLRTNYAAIKIPVYAFAALLDGYRDFAINMLEHGHAPIRVAIGPQNHAWPDSEPGPGYEWRQMAIQFWSTVLKNKKNNFWRQPNFTVFLRDVDSPQAGSYKQLNWPIENASRLTLFPQANGTLLPQPGKQSVNERIYKANTGKGILNWWGEETPDMNAASKGAFIYESPVLENDLYVLGNPKISLKVAQRLLETNQQDPNDFFAHWIVRLEDVNPDGSVAFVTGGLKNSAHRVSRRQPKSVRQNEFYQLNFPLHFTTWTFLKGHKIRLVVSNALFPMIWPTAENMRTQIEVGTKKTQFVLPLIPHKEYAKPNLPPIESDEPIPHAKFLQKTPLEPFKISKDKKGNVIARTQEAYELLINDNQLAQTYKVFYRVNKKNPADAEFIGEGEDKIITAKDKRKIVVSAKITIRSDKKLFYTTVERNVFENGVLIKNRVWQEKIPRDFE